LEQICHFNKQLRQFKKVHERNKLLTEESLREDSMEEENFIPEIPETKEMVERYTAFDSKVRSAKQKMAAVAILERDRRMATVGSLHKTLPRMKKKKRPVSPLVSPSGPYPGAAVTKSTEFLPTIPKVDQEDLARSLADSKDLQIDVFKSLESLNEEIRSTLPWTTPQPDSADSPKTSRGGRPLGGKASGGRSFLECSDTSMLTTSILDLSEDEEEARRRGEPRKLGQIEDELRCRRTAEKNGISDILDDTKVAETEHMHERKMKQLEKEQAEEKKRMVALEREEEEKRRKKGKEIRRREKEEKRSNGRRRETETGHYG